MLSSVYSMVGDDFSYAMYLKAFYQDEINRLERIKEDAILETQKYRQKFKGLYEFINQNSDLVLELVKYSESRVAEVENNVKYLRRENEELKLDLEILRAQMPSRSRNTSLTDDSSSTISRFEFQVINY